MKTIFGGYTVSTDSPRKQLPVTHNPDDLTIDKTVAIVAENSGVLNMRFDPAPEFGPYELTMYAENGQFLLMLNEVAEDGESDTRTLTNISSKNELVSILGEKYPAKAVTHDIALVCLIFKDFSRTGDVSSALLG